MSAGAGLPILNKSELLERLAQGCSAAIAVVTPNRRLSAALIRDFDSHQIARGLASWESADVLPFSAFVERSYEDALYSELATRLPILLSGAEEQALWEEAIAASESGKALLSTPSAAELARGAWQIAHEWKLAPRLKSHPANDDAKAFTEWAWRYEGITRRDRHTDRARLPETVALHLMHAAVKKPRVLVAYGFDTLKPQQGDFLAALAATGAEIFACGPEPRISKVRRVPFISAIDELRVAASWSRARLEADPKARIGIVVPHLARSRAAVRRIFSQTMEPAQPLPGGERRAVPFDISLGEPLVSYPLVAAAFLALDAAKGEIEFQRASRLVRSPFIAGAETEAANRARLDAQLRKASGAKTSLAQPRRFREIRKRKSLGLKAPGRVGKGDLRAARPLRVSRRARARLIRIPDAQEIPRSARRFRGARPGRRTHAVRRRLRAAAAHCCRYAVPARGARSADSGARHTGSGGNGIRSSVGHGTDRRGLAYPGAPEPAHPGRLAACRGRARILREFVARARPAHHRGLAESCGRSRALARAARGR